MKPINSRPIYVTECANLVKKIGANVWLLEKAEYGFCLRCEKGPAQFRVILPPITGNSVPVPDEKGCFYLVKDLLGLKAWLERLR